MTMATESIRDALLPSFVIDGAINPMMISGTQKLITWPRMYFRVTTTFRIAMVRPESSVELNTRPKMIPSTTPTRSLNGRLLKNCFSSYENPPSKSKFYVNLLYAGKRLTILINVYTVDHNVKNFRICGTHADTADIAHALDGFFHIAFDDSFAGKEALVPDA